MEQDIDHLSPTEPTLSIIQDNKVAHMLQSQIALIPPNTYTLRSAYQHIFITVKLSIYKQHKQTQTTQPDKQQLPKKSRQIESLYCLKISRRFPLKQSVRLLMLDGNCEPKISDTRDLMQCVMGKPYNYSMCFIDILDQLIPFDMNLHHKTQLFLQMQKLGKFNLGQKYYYHQLVEMYSSLLLMKDHSINAKKSNIYIGVSQTHILTFKELQNGNTRESNVKLRHPKTVAVSSMKQVIQKQPSEQTLNQLILVAVGDLQCIDSIDYKQSQKQIKIIYHRYKSIKLYHEYEQIKKQYKFTHPQIFLRAILKHISKFQLCAIQLQPYRDNHKKQKKPTITESIVTHRQNQRINFYIDQSSRLEQLVLKKQIGQQQRKKNLQQLNRFYQKLIEYYSARTNPYYLIYVNKLNLLYTHHYNKSQPNISITK